MKKKFKSCFIMFLLFVFGSSINAQTTYYVSANNGNDNNAGTSAATAFKTLFKAIEAMKSNTDAEVTILVEGGVYKPTDGTGDNTNRDATFALFRDYFNNSGKKLKVFGGYNFSTGQRDFIKNPSYLDGDIGTAGDASDNSYHLIAIANTQPDTDSLIINGFTIRNGRADGSGLFLLTPNALIERYRGAGINLLANFSNNKLVIEHCVFTNDTSLEGGAFNNTASAPLVRNCVFTNNSGIQFSGGAFLNDGDAVLSNCVFTNNSAELGGAIFQNSNSTLTIINSTFVGNNASFSGYNGAVAVSFGPAVIKNSVFWGNSAGVTVSSPGTADISYSNLQEAFSGTNNISQQPLFLNINNGTGIDGFWMTADDGFQLLPCSPGIDAANNAAIPNYLTTDIKADNRIFNTTADMGAYETSSLPGQACSTCANATGLTATNITSSSAKLRWTASVNPARWQVQYKKAVSGATWTNIRLAGSARSVNISSLRANQAYRWRIRAKCGTTWTSFSAIRSFKTLPNQSVSSTTTQQSTQLKIEAEEESPTIKLYPNPTRGQFIIELHLTDHINANAKIQFVNMMGQMVSAENANVSNGVLQKTVSVSSSLTPGIYVVKVVVNDKTYVSKLIYEK